MTAATSPAPAVRPRRGRVTRLLTRPAPTTRQRLDDALAAIGAAGLAAAVLRITDLINPHLLGGIHL